MTTVQTIRERQGLGKLTPEEYHQERAARRAKNVANAREILARNGIEFREQDSIFTNGSRIRFIISLNFGIERSYYPETGEWYDLNQNAHFGCRNLVKYLKGSCT